MSGNFWVAENGNVIRRIQHTGVFSSFVEYSEYEDAPVAHHPALPLGAQKLSVNHRLASVEADLDTAHVNLQNHIDYIAVLNKRIGKVRELVENWLDGYGPGTHIARVFGPQTVSVQFLHEQIIDALDNEETAQLFERNPRTLEKLYAAEARIDDAVEMKL